MSVNLNLAEFYDVWDLVMVILYLILAGWCFGDIEIVLNEYPLGSADR
jgi:hypothetical protein